MLSELCTVFGMTACAGGKKEEKTSEKTENTAETPEKEKEEDSTGTEETRSKKESEDLFPWKTYPSMLR